MVDTSAARDQMVRRQIAARGITNAAVLEAMREVPRETFVAPEYVEFAYEDSALPIEAGQTISQPYIVAHMIEAAEVEPGERVLDVGTGSGYGAAVLSRIADRVFTIERHEQLAEAAARRLAAAGYDNVEVRTGDGTAGWPAAAPFDAIIVAAGAPEVPEPLKAQLAIGGRLVLPIGPVGREQRLIRVTRLSDDAFEEEDLGAVAFVPLIGGHGWAEPDGGTASVEGMKRAPAPVLRQESIPEMVGRAAEPLVPLSNVEFGASFDRFADAKVVLLGEATHGTSDFYRARAAITRQLVEHHGFTIVAVEADWPDAAAVNRYIRHRPAVDKGEPAFGRFPTWMWRNQEFDDFVDWLRAYNATHGKGRLSFHGLDLYSLNASIRAVLDYLDRVDPGAAAIARERYGCLTPWQHAPAAYGRAALSPGFGDCEADVMSVLRDLLERKLDYARRDPEAFLDAEQNARLVASAEEYYRAMYYGAAESWNLRDRHMFATLESIMSSSGSEAKAVIWAHNSHIGNAAATEMGLVRDEINLGQLCRERFGDEAVLIGFGTHTGTVAAASDWDGPMEIMPVRPSRQDSYERLWHESAVASSLLDLKDPSPLTEALLEPRLQRAIGVVYRPESEMLSHYLQATLPQQFDAYVWFDKTTAVTPLAVGRREGVPDTYPFGL